jgi:hypothetical protein
VRFLRVPKVVLLKSAVSTDNVDYSPSIFSPLPARHWVISFSLSLSRAIWLAAAAREEAYRKD